jgi:hypothetical protein
VATKGVAVVVATDVHPVIAVPPRVKETAPAALVVATIVAGLDALDPGTTPLPPLRTMVDVVAAAEAAPTPKVITLPRTMAPIAMPDMILFILYCLLFVWCTT